MKNLLLTTILATGLGVVGAIAQTSETGTSETGTAETGTTTMDGTTAPTITAPEGFERQDMALTAEDLLGATIYDTAGDAIGTVHDLVLDKAVSGGSAPAATGADATTGSMSDTSTGTATDTATGTAGDAPADGTLTQEGTATTGTDNATGTMDTDSTAQTPDATGTTGTDSAGDPVPGADTTTTTDGTAGTSTDMTAGTTGVTEGATTETAGNATHAVLDIGGFLGMGEHRVAVPIADLQIYRSDSETRVYLPWTREQLEALPTYAAEDPSTLGTATSPAEN